MKKTFTKEYIAANAGCYEDTKKLAALLQSAPETITIADILQSNIPLVDKAWFICNSCKLTKQQLREFAIGCAELALPAYEAAYPNDSRVRDCIETTKKYIAGEIFLKELWREKRDAVLEAATAAYAVAYAANAAFYAANIYSNLAHMAADAAANAIGEEKILQYLTEFVNKID